MIITKDSLYLKLQEGLSIHDISKHFKVSESTIFENIKKYNLKYKKYNYIDYSGIKIDKITPIITIGTNKKRHRLWLCECECGNKNIVFSSVQLKGRKYLECDECKHKRIKNKKTQTSKTRLYICWQHMKDRCYNIKNKNFHQYGGRGIYVCKEWINDFYNFKNWAINNGYTEKLTLDRIDVNGIYEPKNCRWTTIKKQQNNRRNNKIIEFNGQFKTLSEWCDILNLNYSTINSRINRGNVDCLIALGLSGKYKNSNYNYFEWKGELKTWKEWCVITGEKLHNVNNRIKNCGWTEEEALGLVIRKNKI